MTIPELIERVGKLTGADREVDARLWWEFDHERAVRAYWTASTGLPQPMDEFPRSRGLGYGYVVRSAPAYTASVDAALALVERKLPGWGWGVAMNGVKTGERTPEGYPRYGDGFKAHVTKRNAIRTMPEIAAAPTPALAIILALLKALHSLPESTR